MDHQNGRKPSESLKKMLSKAGALKTNAECSRMLYTKFTINGVNYCRAHLLIRCHLCEEDNSGSQDDCDSEREELSLRCGGDARLNKRAEKWGNRTLDMVFVAREEIDALQGKGIPASLRMEHKSRERAVNEEFLADVARVFEEGASQCCYWGCKQPDADKLSRCSGCGVVKYCSKEHQMLDWKWEHKFECTKSVPKYVRDEIEADRQRNLQGNYDHIDRF